MSPHSNDDDDDYKPSIFCCCFRAKPKKEPEDTYEDTNEDTNGVAQQRSAPAVHSNRCSVYMTARETLDESQLAALKEFEDAVIEDIGGGSVYFDALEQAAQGGVSLYAPASVRDPRPPGSVTMEDPSTLLLQNKRTHPRGGKVVDIPGYPGNLTQVELDACLKFREELQKRKNKKDTNGGIWEEAVRIYHPVESEPFALCRFLRARQFNVDLVFEMMTNTMDIWKDGRQHNFYPDPNESIGAPTNVLLSQLPLVYSGCAKNGSPVTYAKAGGLSIEGIEAVTQLETMYRYGWYQILHKLKDEVAKAQTKNPDLVVRCETVQIIDLKGLNVSALNKRTLACLKNLINVNNCFPEVLNAMLIMNAPYFFSFFWRIIKTMLDPRTAGKIEIISNEKDAIAWMNERIDKSELLVDFGGNGDTMEAAIGKQRIHGNHAKRQVAKLLSITQKDNKEVKFTLAAGEKVDSFKAYSRSALGAQFELWKGGKKTADATMKGSTKKGSEGTPIPISATLFVDVQGPGNFCIKSKGKADQPDHFVVAGEVFPV